MRRWPNRSYNFKTIIDVEQFTLIQSKLMAHLMKTQSLPANTEHPELGTSIIVPSQSMKGAFSTINVPLLCSNCGRCKYTACLNNKEICHSCIKKLERDHELRDRVLFVPNPPCNTRQPSPFLPQNKQTIIPSVLSKLLRSTLKKPTVKPRVSCYF